MSMEGRPEKKIAIVGFTNSRNDAPWGEPDWEIWICNNLWKFCPPSWTRLYDLHDMATITGDNEHEGFLRGQTCKTIDGHDVQLAGRPAIVFDAREQWPTSVEYPKALINDTFGRYFTNSISWMIAHALVEGVTELHVYGVDMATGTEYAGQRPSCEYFLGLAVGAGVKVFVPPQSDLLKVVAMYGAEDDGPLYAKIAEREKELKERMAQVQNAHHQAELQGAQLQGALETTQYFKQVWTNPRADRSGAAKGLQDGKTDMVAVREAVADVAEVQGHADVAAEVRQGAESAKVEHLAKLEERGKELAAEVGIYEGNGSAKAEVT